jgi:hypothetical protein
MEKKIFDVKPRTTELWRAEGGTFELALNCIHPMEKHFFWNKILYFKCWDISQHITEIVTSSWSLYHWGWKLIIMSNLVKRSNLNLTDTASEAMASSKVRSWGCWDAQQSYISAYRLVSVCISVYLCVSVCISLYQSVSVCISDLGRPQAMSPFSKLFRHWTYYKFFDILSYQIICQKNDIISFISYREKNDMIEYHISFCYHLKKNWS